MTAVTREGKLDLLPFGFIVNTTRTLQLMRMGDEGRSCSFSIEQNWRCSMLDEQDKRGGGCRSCS